MTSVPLAKTTKLLVRSSQREKTALDQWLPLISQELRQLAHHQ